MEATWGEGDVLDWSFLLVYPRKAARTWKKILHKSMELYLQQYLFEINHRYVIYNEFYLD